jgi:hypothetical protein
MAEHLEMTTGSVLDILIYVFDRYMLVEAPEVPRREQLARDLERAGFAPAKVERALDWLTDLAFGPGHEPSPARHRAAEVGRAHGAFEPAGVRVGGRAARRTDAGSTGQCAALSGRRRAV